MNPPDVIPSPSTGEGLTLTRVDAVDREFIANDFGIGTYTVKYDFDNHLKVTIFEGVHPSDSLDELAKKTDAHDELAYLAGSTFSRLTNDRAVLAVVSLFFEQFHLSQLYHQRAVQRKRLSWLDQAVVATDATNLALARPVPIPSGRHDSETLRVIQPGGAGMTA